MFLAFFFWTAWPLKMDSVGCPETSVTNYLSVLRKIQKLQRPHLDHGRRLISCKCIAPIPDTERKMYSMPSIQDIKIFLPCCSVSYMKRRGNTFCENI
jgi:hypothetical protein